VAGWDCVVSFYRITLRRTAKAKSAICKGPRACRHLSLMVQVTPPGKEETLAMQHLDWASSKA
jgi:hypothetical protein